MKTNLSIIKWLALAVLAIFNLQPATAFAQGTTAFTYQGQLHDGGTNANGAYTMIFKLCDAVSGGNQVGSTVTTSATLANGLFSVDLDFGAGAFNGSARWLDITVSNGVEQVLSPRVQVLPAPYAQFAAVAATVTNGAIMNAQLAGSAVATTNIQNDAVTTVQLADGAVTNRNLAANAVATANIQNNSVTDAKIVSVSGGKVTGTVASAANAFLLGGLSSANFAQLNNNPIFTDGLSLQQGTAGATVWDVSVGSASGPASYSLPNCLIFSANGVPCLVVANMGVWAPNGLGATEVDCGEMNVRDSDWNTVAYIDSSGNISCTSLAISDNFSCTNFTASGNITVNGNITVHGDGEVGGPYGNPIYGNITANGDGQIDGFLNVGGDLNVGGNLAVDGCIHGDFCVASNMVAGTVSAKTLNTTSDRNLKENFATIDSREVLESVARLPISRWNFKTDGQTRHIGPMAQDFYAAFNIGTDDKHIATVDEGGVALAAIQGLNEKLKEKDARIEALEKRLADLEQLVKTSAQK
jgi:hypothetical protein